MWTSEQDSSLGNRLWGWENANVLLSTACLSSLRPSFRSDRKFLASLSSPSLAPLPGRRVAGLLCKLLWPSFGAVCDRSAALSS